MRGFQAKKRIRRILYSKGIVILLFIVFLFMTHATWKVFKKERESATNAVQASRELAKLKDRHDLLKHEIGRLSTEEGIEEEIRAKYSVIKPGEEVVVIVDSASSTPVAEQPEENWWGKFKNLFR